MAIADKNQRWARRGQRKCLHQAPASQGEGVRVPDAKCFEGQTGRGERRWAGGHAGEAKDKQTGRPALQTWPLGPSLARGVTAWEQLQKRYKAQQFIAYFQPSTNTYGDLTRLRTMWETAISHPKVVGLIIGTRPDCVGEDVLNALGELAQKKWTSLELGVQSLHDSTLEIINRGHNSACALDAIDRAKRIDKLHVGTHIILGLPGETPEMMNQTADRLAQTPIDAVKIHNIYVARNTVLEQWYKSGQFTLPTREEYISWAADFIERMPENVVIDRISASVPAPYLVAPDWCSDSSGILLDLEAEFERRGTCQGSRQ